jgi:cytochrome P450
MGSVNTRELPPGLRAPALAQTALFWRWPLEYLSYCRAHYGSVFTLSAVHLPPLVFLSNPNDVRNMLAASPEDLLPGRGGDIISPIVGEHSFMLHDGDDHMRVRRAVLPAFRSRVVRAHSDRIADITSRAIATWPRDRPIALHPRLRALTLEVILRSIFGTATDQRLYTIRARVLAMLTVTATPLLVENQLRRLPLGRSVWDRFNRRRAEVDVLIYEEIDDRATSQDDNPPDLLSLLIDTHKDSLSDSRKAVRDDAMSLILAGHETTSSALAWAFQLLAHHADKQATLKAELDTGQDSGYLSATVKEVLRHRPVFLFTIPRLVSRPIELASRTFYPPIQLLGCIYLVHHNPDLYHRPGEFLPERFLGPDRHGRPLWMPWGGGRRRCPGQHLAMLEMSVILKTVLRSVRVEPAGHRMEHAYWRSVIVAPHAGSRVILRDDRRRRSSV